MDKEPHLEENISQEIEIDFPWVHHAIGEFFLIIPESCLLFKDIV